MVNRSESLVDTAATDIVWRAVSDAAGSSYDILGELARDAEGAIAFVGRSLADNTHAILKLEPEPPTSGARRYSLFELKTLDDTIPAPRISCPVCSALVASWRGRCPACGSAIGAGSAAPVASDVLLAFYQFASAHYDVVTEFPLEGAGPPVYLVRDRAEPQYSMLRLATGGTSSKTQAMYVVDVLPLTPRGAAPLTPSRAPLQLESATTVMSSQPNITPAPTNAERVCPQCGSTFAGGTLFCPRDGASLRLVTVTEDLVGQLIDDRYFVEKRLGEGGMGEVYAAHQVRTGRKCALKLMHRSMTQDADAVGRFRREAASACAISHPHVATLFDSGETSDGRPYFAMEFIDGRPLSSLIRDTGVLEPWRAADIARQIADGLSAAHDIEIVHRDLKPDNVMLGAARGGADYVKLVDFGIAKPSKGAGSGNTLTRTGFILGTPAYMSPEQLCAEKLDGRTDLYSLGCVLFEMLTGQVPFADQSIEGIMMRRLSEAPPSARAFNDKVPAVLDEIVLRLLARAPEDRYSDARAVAEVLAAAQDAIDVTRAGSGARKRDLISSAARSGATIAPGTGDAATVEITTTSRPPRRSQDIVPTAPLSPAIPFRPPQRSGDTVAVPAPTAETKPARKMSAPIIGVAVVVIAAGGFAAWRVAAKQPAPATVAPAPTTVAKADSVPTVSAVSAPPTAPATDTQTKQAVKDVPAQPAPQPTQTAKTVTKAPVPTTNPSSTPATKAQASAAAPNTQPATGSPTTAAPQTKAVDNPPPPSAVPESKPTVAAAPATKSAAEVAADADRAEAPAVRDVIESWARGINGKQMDALQRIFPNMPSNLRQGYDALFKSASDLSAQLVGPPTVNVHGATADAEFTLETKGRSASAGGFDQRSLFRVKLQKASQGWLFQTLDAAR